MHREVEFLVTATSLDLISKSSIRSSLGLVKAAISLRRTYTFFHSQQSLESKSM